VCIVRFVWIFQTRYRHHSQKDADSADKHGDQAPTN
jgi:hypothetical protein